MPHELLHAIWTLAFCHICLFTLGPVQLLLRLVECIKSRAQRVFQRAHVAVRMQHFPRVRAFASFARLEDDEQSVQSGDDFGNGSA
jgi:hypothetical protein